MSSIARPRRDVRTTIHAHVVPTSTHASVTTSVNPRLRTTNHRVLARNNSSTTPCTPRENPASNKYASGASPTSTAAAAGTASAGGIRDGLDMCSLFRQQSDSHEQLLCCLERLQVGEIDRRRLQVVERRKTFVLRNAGDERILKRLVGEILLPVLAQEVLDEGLRASWILAGGENPGARDVNETPCIAVAEVDVLRHDVLGTFSMIFSYR